MLRQGRQLAIVLMGAGRATAVGSLLSRGFQSSTASQNVVEKVWQESWDKVTNMYKSAKTKWDALLLAIEDNVEIPTDPEDPKQVKKYVKQMDAAFAAAGLENNLPVHFQKMLRDEWEAATSIETFLAKLNLPQDDIAAITAATGGKKDKQAMQAAVEELLKKDGVVPNTPGNLDHLKETMAHMTLGQIKEQAENMMREEKERLEREFGVEGIPLPEYKDVVPKRISAE